MKPEITASSGLRPSIRTSKRPQCHAGVARGPPAPGRRPPAAAWCRHAGTAARRRVAAAAPAFICAPRPRGAAITRSASGRAIATVRSRLPPSATITSAPRSRNGASAASAAPMRASSSSTGTMMESEAMRGRRGGYSAASFSAPPQLDPWPAVQPKQWPATRIGLPSRSSSSSSDRCTRSLRAARQRQVEHLVEVAVVDDSRASRPR